MTKGRFLNMITISNRYRPLIGHMTGNIEISSRKGSKEDESADMIGKRDREVRRPLLLRTRFIL